MKYLFSAGSWLRQHPIKTGVAALVLLGIVLAAVAKPTAPENNYSYYEVRKGDFLVSVVEGGTIEAVTEDVIRSEVEGTARIIYIVPEGTVVKKGDLLVELDSSATQDAVNQQQINVEKAQFAFLQAEAQLEIEKSTSESEIKAAELKVEFAESDLNKYIKGEALQLRRNAEIEITNVLETLEIAKERLEWTRKLYEKGFETKSNLDKDVLAVSQGTLKLEQAQKALWLLETFDAPKKKRELEALLIEAKENLGRVKLQGEKRMAQFQGDVATQKSTLELNKSKLERDLEQLKATKIYAPADGLVVYSTGGGRFSSESMIEEGAVVRNRQELIKLPDISQMKVQIKIHESHINNIKRGQRAFVILDSMPDQRFMGVVNRVAPLPDSSSRWMNPNLKVYATEILVTDKLPDIKPGVSARAEVIVTNLPSVLSIPIQAVTTRKGKPVVFLQDDPLKPIPVEVGMYNTKFIEVIAGLKEGAHVMLAPPMDSNEKDLGGSVLVAGEDIPAQDSNQVAKALAAQRPPAEFEAGARRSREGAAVVDGPSDGFPGEGRRRGGEANVVAGATTGGPETGRGNREGRSGFNREEMMKQWDKNADGQLDETERAAMRASFGSGGAPGGGRRRGGGEGSTVGGGEGRGEGRPRNADSTQSRPPRE